MSNLIDSKILVTGGCGFIGSNFIRLAIDSYNCKILNLDKLSTVSDKEFMQNSKNYQLEIVDLENFLEVERCIKSFIPDYIVHFASESHVDRSIQDPSSFLKSNILGSFNLFEVTRNLINIGILKSEIKLINISTDEVYGSLKPKDKPFSEKSPSMPSSPYSASKLGIDGFALAYAKTFGMKITTTRCSNNFGPRQFPEKLIPSSIYRMLKGMPIHIYGNGKNIRDWIYVDDHNKCVLKILESEMQNEPIINIGSRNELSNLEIIKLIEQIIRIETGQSVNSRIEYIADRLGHDLRYAINPSLAEKFFNWHPENDFFDNLRYTIKWYLSNLTWLESRFLEINES